MNQPTYQPFGPAVTMNPVAFEQAAFMRKVYAFMAGGLAATGLTAALVASSLPAQQLIFGNPMVFFGLLFAELAMVWSFSAIARRTNAAGAAALFTLYAVTNGLTLAAIFFRYSPTSIATTFFVTGGTFAAMSAYGYATKRDLSGVGSFMMMGLFGLILASVANLFLHSEPIAWLITCVGLLVFVGLTAYDTQKIRQLAVGGAGSDEEAKGAIHGALILYLDFINLFLFMLRLLGRRR